VEEGEGRLQFHIVLQDMVSHQAALAGMTPSVIAADTEADQPTLPREPNPRHAETAPLLLLGMLRPMQPGMTPMTPPNPLDQAGNQPSQVLDGPTSSSPQALPIFSSSTKANRAMPGLPPMSPPESREVALPFTRPAPVGMDQETKAMNATAVIPSTATPSIDRHAQGPVVAYPVMETADSSLDSSIAGAANVHASALNASTTPSIDATQVSQPIAVGQQISPASGKIGEGAAVTFAAVTPIALVDGSTAPAPASPSILTPGNTAVGSTPQPIAEPQVSPTIGTAGEVETPVESDGIGWDQPDTSPGGDLGAASTPRARKLESSETPINYAEAAQSASGMRNMSATTAHAELAGQPVADAEPTPIIDQLIGRLPAAVQDGQHELRLQLAPENLGTVLVDISAEQLEVQARLVVENPAVKEALEANLHKLRDALQAQGLHVQGLSVSVGQQTLQHESMAGHLSYEERLWPSSRGFTTDEWPGGMAAVSERLRFVTDSRQVDLFI